MNPQLEASISNTFLTKVLQTIVPTQLPCPNANSTPLSTSTQILTDLVITEVVAFRGDDPNVVDPNGKKAADALTTLGNNFGFNPLGTGYVAETNKPVGEAFAVPRTYLLVSGSLRSLTLGVLRAAGSSEASSVIPLTFSRTPVALLPALLFSIDVVAAPGLNSLTFAVELLGAFNSVIDSSAGPFFTMLMSAKQQFGTKQFNVTLDSVLTQLNVGGITQIGVNRGLIADLWPAKNTPATVALRLGLDFYTPDNTDGWRAFFNPIPLRPALLDSVADARNDIAIALDGDFIIGALTYAVTNAKAGITFGSDSFIQFRIGDPSVSLGTQLLQIKLPIVSGDLHGGDVWVNVTPQVVNQAIGSFGYVGDFLSLQACVSIDLDVGTEIFAWILTNIFGAALLGLASTVDATPATLAGPLLPFATAEILGLLPGILQSVIDKKIASLSSPRPFVCGAETPDHCRTCTIRLDSILPILGKLDFTGFLIRANGMGITFTLASRTPLAVPPPPLAIKTFDWEYETKVCVGSSQNPSKRIVLSNTGAMPIEICLVDQDANDGAQPAILEITPTINGSAQHPARILSPRESLAFSALAPVTGNPAYDQAAPPPLWLRVLSSAGAFEIDLNSPSPALTQNAADQATADRIAQLLCKLLTTAVLNDIWQLPFVDPVEFSIADQVIERIDLLLPSLLAGGVVEGFDSGERRVAQAFSGDGTALSLTSVRAPALAHSVPSLSFALNGSFVSSGNVLVAGTGASRVVRSLYRRRQSLSAGGPIFAAAATTSRLAVLIESGLNVTTVAGNTLTRGRSTAVHQPRDIDAAGNRIAVAHAKGVTIYDEDLEILHATHHAAHAVTIRGREAWLVQGDALVVLTDEGKAWRETRRMHGALTKQLLSGDGAVFALVHREVWLVSETMPRRLGVVAERLARIAGRVAAVLDDVVVVFDEQGRVVARYEDIPWLARIFEWPGLTVEIQRGAGTVTLYERYETPIDAGGLPENIRTRLARLATGV